MNPNEIFVYIILPLMIAAAGTAIGFFYGRGVKHDDHSASPGE